MSLKIISMADALFLIRTRDVQQDSFHRFTPALALTS